MDLNIIKENLQAIGALSRGESPAIASDCVKNPIRTATERAENFILLECSIEGCVLHFPISGPLIGYSTSLSEVSKHPGPCYAENGEVRTSQLCA